MSVRRLAEPAVQPASFAFSRANAASAKQWIRKYPKGREQSAVIPLLMLAQEQEGWVTKAAIEHVSGMLDMPLIRVLEVATFYTQFQLKPIGTRAHVQVCGTTPCMLRGSEALMDVCRSKIHHDQFHTNASGTLSWEEVECLGACVNAPMVMIFKDTYEDLTPERLGEIIDTFEKGKGAAVPVGPQNGRIASAPESGLTTLLDEKPVLKSSHEKEPKAAARSVKAVGEVTVAPLEAGKPKTDAVKASPASGKKPV
jgi:NADH-quinone oxidoreductase subunit E